MSLRGLATLAIAMLAAPAMASDNCAMATSDRAVGSLSLWRATIGVRLSGLKSADIVSRQRRVGVRHGTLRQFVRRAIVALVAVVSDPVLAISKGNG